MKKTKGITLTIIISSLLILGAFTNTVSAVENFPTIWIKIYRIQGIDTIENSQEGQADWRYTITVNDGETLTTREFKCPSNTDDIIVDRSDSFTNIKNQSVFVTIILYEDDQSDSETADISSSGTFFDCTYNIASSALGGDETITDGEYYKTSGDYDGTSQTDENDANIWFSIFDNYDAPVANAGEEQTVYTNEEVNFDGTFSTASEGSSIVKFEWDFEDDGSIDAQGEKTSYSYTQKGTRTYRLIVTDSIGAKSEDTGIVNVINRNPIANFTVSPTNISIQDMVNITDASSDLDGTIDSWFWDFGDGINSTSQNTTHTFTQKGEWQVTLTVIDNDGAENSITQTVTVINLQPEACFECNTTSIQTDMDIQFTDNSTDPENNPVSWLWNFGDGNTSEIQNPTHKYATAGDYNVTLTVMDDENATSTFTMTVSVTEPQAEATSLWILVAFVVSVAAIGFLGMLWWNRRRKSFPEMFTGSNDPAI